MTTGCSYDGTIAGTFSYINQIATMAVVEPTDTAFLTILPSMITYAENRMYRDLDFLFTSVASTAYSTTVKPSGFRPNRDFCCARADQYHYPGRDY